MVRQDSLAENSPFLRASRLVCAVQALIRVGQLLGNCPMHFDAKALTESPYAGGVVARYPHCVAGRAGVFLGSETHRSRRISNKLRCLVQCIVDASPAVVPQGSRLCRDAIARTARRRERRPTRSHLRRIG